MIYHIPKKDKWEFDDSVTDIFEDMLSRSIPQYSVMRKAVTSLTCGSLKKGDIVVDIGSSRGEQIAEIIKECPYLCDYHGLEVSEPMVAASNERFKDYSNVVIHQLDLRRDWVKISNVSVILSILTLQFIPMEYRSTLLKKIYNTLKPGGIFILVEKVLGASASLDDSFVQTYYNLKHENGYSVYEIERKRLSLEGVLVPVTASWNEEMVRVSGFHEVDCFWRWMNFAGFIAIKE